MRTVNSSKDRHYPTNVAHAEVKLNNITCKVDEHKPLFNTAVRDDRDHKENALVSEEEKEGQEGLFN